MTLHGEYILALYANLLIVQDLVIGQDIRWPGKSNIYFRVSSSVLLPPTKLSFLGTGYLGILLNIEVCIQYSNSNTDINRGSDLEY